MNTIGFQPTAYRPRPAAQASPHFAAWPFGKSKKAVDTLEKTASSDKLIQGSIGQGISRALKMTFLRPRGWAELALMLASHFTINFPVIHFIEGWVGADSIYVKRRWGTGFAVKKDQFNGRTLVDAAKDFLNRFSFFKKK